jgi:putative peptide zinc metalloprotease protein
MSLEAQDVRDIPSRGMRSEGTPERVTAWPCRRPELVIAPAGQTGCYVVKDPRAGVYYHIEGEEHFLLCQLDGSRSAEMIRAAFARRFGKVLRPEELAEFLETARSHRFLVHQGAEGAPGGIAPNAAGELASGTVSHGLPGQPSPTVRPRGRSGPRRFTWQSILSWRINLFDPDRLFCRVEPKIRLFWTRGFLVASAGSILLAIAVVWSNEQELVGSFVQALRWETAVLAWFVVFAITTAHEFAHGLTCKHYGGEVHEVGFFMLLLMPCFYCNVSDAWMFREKSKRLWVMFAGAWFELFVWSLGVFVWRLTQPGTLPNYLAFVLLSSSGLATLFNYNPLIKLDGYYMLSDWLEVPNLHDRAHAYFKGQLRRLIWGAPKTDEERRSGVLLGFGLVSWVYSVAFLGLMLWGLGGFLARRWGWLGAIGAALLGYLGARGLLRGLGPRAQPVGDPAPGMSGHEWIHAGWRPIRKFLANCRSAIRA